MPRTEARVGQRSVNPIGWKPRRALRGLLAGVLLLPIPVSSQPEELAGPSAVFAARGVAVLWGVLRGPDETRTQVVLWIERFDAEAPWRFASVEAMDPFSGQRELIRLALDLETERAATVDMPREGFVAKPGRRILLFRDAQAVQNDRPGLIVSYAGIPDAVPEFASGADLIDYFRRVRERLPSR